MSGNTPVRTFRLDDDRWDRLGEYADKHHLTASELLREMIDQLDILPTGSPPLKFRGFYASDDLWHAAQAEAERRGETVSEAIRRSLRRYVRPRKDAA